MANNEEKQVVQSAIKSLMEFRKRDYTEASLNFEMNPTRETFDRLLETADGLLTTREQQRDVAEWKDAD